jgi:hypothetical protein
MSNSIAPKTGLLALPCQATFFVLRCFNERAYKSTAGSGLEVFAEQINNTSLAASRVLSYTGLPEDFILQIS